MNKHLKRLILVALTLTMALSCLPVFSVFAEEEPEAPQPTVTLTIEGDKEIYTAGEPIRFVISGDGESDEFWLAAPGEFLPSKQDVPIFDRVVATSFSVPGMYTAHVVTYVDGTALKSESVTFSVDCPTVSTLTIDSDKTLFRKGEDITFVMGGNGDYEELWIAAPGKAAEKVVKEEGEFNDEAFTTSFSESGTYSAYTVSVIGEQTLQSETVTFNVGRPTFATIAIEGDATLFDVNTDIPFVVTGDGDVEEIWVIGPDGGEAKLKQGELTDGTHALAFDQPGSYIAYVVSRLDDELKSAEIAFHVGKTTVADITCYADAPTCSVGSSLTFLLTCNNGECVLWVTDPVTGEQASYTPDEYGLCTVTFDKVGTYILTNKASNIYTDLNNPEDFATKEMKIVVLEALSTPNDSANPNPGTTTQQAPQTPDYGWVLPLIVWTVVVLIIGVIILVKVLKKRKKAKPAEQ